MREPEGQVQSQCLSWKRAKGRKQGKGKGWEEPDKKGSLGQKELNPIPAPLRPAWGLDL